LAALFSGSLAQTAFAAYQAAANECVFTWAVAMAWPAARAAKQAAPCAVRRPDGQQPVPRPSGQGVDSPRDLVVNEPGPRHPCPFVRPPAYRLTGLPVYPSSTSRPVVSSRPAAVRAGYPDREGVPVNRYRAPAVGTAGPARRLFLGLGLELGLGPWT
jgi:hypothetical protein